jgi:hypothetical protein
MIRNPVMSSAVAQLKHQLDAETLKAMSPDLQERTTLALNRACAELEALDEQAAEIQQSARWSEAGRKDQLKELAVKRASTFEWAGRVLKQVRQDGDTLRRSLYALPPMPDGPAGVAARIEDAESRQYYRTLPEAERQRLFATAVAQQQHAVVRAMTGGPEGGLLDGDARERVLREHAQRTRPGDVQRLDDLEEVQDNLVAMLQGVSQRIEELGGDPAPIQQWMA